MPVKTVTKMPATLDEAMLLVSTSIADMSKKMAESKAETDRAIQRLSDRIEQMSIEAEKRAQEAEKRAQEADKRAQEADKRAIERAIEADKRHEKLREDIELLTSNYGGIGRGLGQLVELIVVPKIRLDINKFGHDFKRTRANKIFRLNRHIPGRKETTVEVDLFLYNGTETMAVEIKTSLSVQDVEKHINQLKKLRKYEEETDMLGKKLYGAMVGVFVDYHARKLAMKNGLYILEIIEEEDRLKTSAPKRARAW
jgi:hypothetical protein